MSLASHHLSLSPPLSLSLFAGRRLTRFPPCLLAVTAVHVPRGGETETNTVQVPASITRAATVLRGGGTETDGATGADADTGSEAGGNTSRDTSRDTISTSLPAYITGACMPYHTYLARFARTLRVLDMSGNEMKLLPDALGHLTALEHLDVSRNFLRTIMPEAALTRLRSLVHLDASSNCFRGLDALRLGALATLPQLRRFNVEFCPKIGAHGAGHTAAIEATLGPDVAVAVTEQAVAREGKLHAADRDATLLRSQIEPHCIGVLRRRLALVYGETTDPDTTNRENVLLRLVALGKGHVPPCFLL